MVTTPIRDFCVDYAEKAPVRLHMPGHKGRGFLGFEEWDLTEIDGADDLYHAEGIIAESEENASKLFGSRTFYSTEGSSLCIRAMLFLALHGKDNRSGCRDVFSRNEHSAKDSWEKSHSQSSRPWVLAGRNAHKVFMYSAALLDFDIQWIQPDETASYHSCPVTAEQVEAVLKEATDEKKGDNSQAAMYDPSVSAIDFRMAMSGSPVSVPDIDRAPNDGRTGLLYPGMPAAVYLTSPDYLGHLADIESIARVCHKYGVPLLVDNAHGAYLHFLKKSLHPMDLGADLCCDSAHKTLPVLTGGAYLHMKEDSPWVSRAKEALGLFGSTSPSYMILQSLDLCNQWLTALPEKLEHYLPQIADFKFGLQAQGYELTGEEPMKVTIAARSYGYTGSELAGFLMKENIFAEFHDPDFLVLMPTPETTRKDLDKVLDVLRRIPPKKTDPGKVLCPGLHIPKPAMSPRQAIFAPQQTLPVRACVGRVFAGAALSCPPAIPIVISGEIVDEEAVNALLYYGIEECRVVK